MDGGVRGGERPPDPFPSSAAGGAAGDGNKGGEHQRQQQREMIRWERFLPRRSLRVLLVEHDDSTRHIVTALLRKCNYHVAAVADGLKAWEVLEEKQYRFDLVLTEVEMPSLSGIGLLSKIMGSELSKNIPVIMMSSHDSVSVVYKCMLKGAVDFLVKPVRRNELRNLWQHVWRKHCSTSCAQGQESINNNTIKSGDMSGNNAASNHVSAVAGSMSKNKEWCDEGSDTQSSGSKPEQEIQSVARPRVTNDAEHMNSSKVLESKLEREQNHKLLLETKSMKHNSRGERNDIAEIREEAISKRKFGEQDFVAEATETNLNNKEDLNDDTRVPGTFDSNLQIKTSNQIIDPIGTVANGECSYAVMEKDNHREEYQFEAIKSLHRTIGSTSDALLSWELSLRGPHLNVSSKEDSQERHILKHSAASAFSRYCAGIHFTYQKSDSSPSTLPITTKAHGDKIESQLSNHIACEEEVPTPTWRLTTAPENESEGITNLQASTATNHEDDGRFATGPSGEDACEPRTSTEDNNCNLTFPSCQPGLVSHPFPVRGMPFQSLCAGYGTYMQPVFYHDSFLAHGSHGPEKEEASKPVDLNHHLVYNLPSEMLQHCKEGSRASPLEGQKDRMDDEELGQRSLMYTDTEQTKKSCACSHNNTNGCSELGTRSFMCSDIEQTNKNCACCRNNLNGNGSNGIDGTTDAAVNRGMALGNDIENRLQNHERKELNQVRREAALIKFRLKRKDRCFEKKVRYHSRKKLAEQRPRIKGQFVRQSATTEDD